MGQGTTKSKTPENFRKSINKTKKYTTTNRRVVLPGGFRTARFSLLWLDQQNIKVWSLMMAMTEVLINLS